MESGMLTSTIEGLLQSADAGNITELFLWGVLVALLWCLRAARVGTSPRLVAYAPTLLTSLGILGTFVGIVVGLMDFDPQDIDGSIEGLLAGLKTAFITSLAGMAAGILFKVLSTTQLVSPNTDEPEEGIGPEDVLKAIETQNELLISIRDGVAKDEESSLAGQFKLLRADIGDYQRTNTRAAEAFQEKLWQQLTDFAEMMSKSATEQVIEALKQVITDFNKNLTEQFGENFKALDASVRKLVEWQENNLKQMEDLHRLYGESVRAITTIEVAMAAIAERTESIPQTMEGLSTLLEAAQHQLDDLQRHLEAFATLRDEAVKAVPEVQGHVEAMTKDMQASVEAASKHYRGMLDTTDSYFEAQNQLTQDLLRAMNKSSEAMQSGLKDLHEKVSQSMEVSQRRLVESVEQVVEQHTRATAAVVESLREEMERAVGTTSEAVNTQLKAMDDAMQQELQSVMQTMGEALGKIAGKFTEDYTQLTSAMQQIVDEAGRRR